MEYSRVMFAVLLHVENVVGRAAQHAQEGPLVVVAGVLHLRVGIATKLVLHVLYALIQRVRMVF